MQGKASGLAYKQAAQRDRLCLPASTTPARPAGLDKMSRLYVKGRITGHQRGKHNSHPRTTLIKIEGVEKPEDTQFYLGKRIAYIYRAPTERRGSKVRVIWGKVTRSHGNSGMVRSKFRTNIPPKAFGASVRIMLYPSSI